jgi:hypothetical protein
MTTTKTLTAPNTYPELADFLMKGFLSSDVEFAFEVKKAYRRLDPLVFQGFSEEQQFSIGTILGDLHSSIAELSGLRSGYDDRIA